MCDVDWDNFEYAIFIGTAPGCSGASINRTGSGLSKARVNRNAKYVCVDPILRSNVTNGTGAQWVPIRPGEDTAFLLALIQVILNSGKENQKFLSAPNEAAAKKNGEINWSNASYLINHRNEHFGRRLRIRTWRKGRRRRLFGRRSQAASKSGPAELYVDRVFTNAVPKNIRYKSALQLLKERAKNTP